MKKQILFLLPALFLSLFSCAEQGETPDFENKVYTLKSTQLTNYVRLQSVDELNYVARNMTAVIMIRQDTCRWCSYDEAKLLEYIPSTQNIVFTVNKDVYLEAYDSNENSYGTYAYLYPEYVGTPTYLYYKDGKCIDTHVGSFSDGDDDNNLVEQFGDELADVDLYVLNEFDYSESTGYYTYNEETFYDETPLNELLAEDPDATILYVDDGNYPSDVLTTEYQGEIYSSGENANLFFRNTTAELKIVIKKAGCFI